MYSYRRLSDQERQALVQERRARGYPPHQPPHPVRGQSLYLLTATCYEHQHYICTPERRQGLLDLLFERFILEAIELCAWVILTNHYHVLVKVPDFGLLGDVFRRVHGRSSHDWNKEDDAPGRRVWYRYSDRAMRSDGHVYTTLNYIHYNPVKHDRVESPYDWPWSSVHWYLEHEGREWLRDLWQRYPLHSYGREWDDL
jgi:putative transposase